jgi:1-deoxy-D-xylulose-5-phosphate synthase
MIKSLNFDYSGYIDGHDIFAIIKELNAYKKSKGSFQSRDYTKV